MTTLHMDVESVQSAQAKMIQGKEAMLGELTSLTSQINQTVGSAWIGNSANEFQGQFDNLRGQITSQLDQLETMASSLQTEIAQWQEMANRMG